MPVTLADIHVVNVQPELSVTATGQPVEMMRIIYQIGDFGPYSVVVPKIEATAQRILTLVRDEASKVIDLLNLQF